MKKKEIMKTIILLLAVGTLGLVSCKKETITKKADAPTQTTINTYRYEVSGQNNKIAIQYRDEKKNLIDSIIIMKNDSTWSYSITNPPSMMLSITARKINLGETNKVKVRIFKNDIQIKYNENSSEVNETVQTE